VIEKIRFLIHAMRRPRTTFNIRKACSVYQGEWNWLMHMPFANGPDGG
jgi:hypothetical protein